MQGMMMMSSGMDSSVVGGVGGPGGDSSHHLYVFETVGEVGEAMDSTQQLLVDHNSQQQFLVDGSQPLLVFPETTTESYSQLPGEPTDNIEPEPHLEAVPEHPDTPEVIMVQEKMEEGIENEESCIDKPFRCEDCGKTFAKKQYLTKHKYRHREVKPHACDVCGKRFAQKFEVAVHKIKHTGERPYSCDVCHKPFRSKVNLLNHKMRHTGEYPFLCSVCRKGFSTQLQLERHVTLHTGSHPYKCNICHKGYTQRTNLIKHLDKAHHVLQLGEGDGEEDPHHGLHTMDGGVSPGVVGAHETERAPVEPQGEDSEEDDQRPGDGQQHHSDGLTMEGHDLLVAEDDQQEAAFSVVEVHPDYLKDYLLAGPQVVSTHDMDPKLLQSILEVHGHQRQAEQTQQNAVASIGITGQDNQAIVHVNAMDES
ncbi:unnamed protein product [Meganyctiphanes norvegica]|uniref:C2H2-type domain-containing protein n=1 Tax=Meganyctiphanes norvegica TaxID=48144 RepID=A0AAV2SA27_MEGNR